MDESIHRSPRPRGVLVVGALVLSVAALAALLHFQGNERVRPVDVSGDSAARPLHAPPPMPGAISGLGVDGPGVGAAPRDHAPTPAAATAHAGDVMPIDAAPETPSDAEADFVVVPDFAGKRLSVARREARALGLRLVARDAYGERVSPSDASSYRVRSQVTPVGARVAPDGIVQVRAREIYASYGEGY